MSPRWSFPFRVDARGRSAVVDHDAHARERIEQVLFTAPGERVVRPEFGAGIHQQLFAPAGDTFAAATEASVRSALQRWVGDLVEVDDVAVEHDRSLVRVTVRYHVLATDQTDEAAFTHDARAGSAP